MLRNVGAVIQCSSVPFIFTSISLLDLSVSPPTGAGTPEEAAAGAGRQVRVGGESVHHCGQLQLLRRGGLAH